MGSRIRVLSDHTINKIAAGEVIENPSSVIKELVENSLDAGASELCIEIRGGGRELIRVSDDGCGMNEDDALLCLERHATSKISSVEEIQDIVTMGFRGEAIPSIASISKFNLTTKPSHLASDSTSLGTMVIVDGGRMVSCSPVACASGTSIEVKSLFFNVPVRKKFMKSPAIDANEILKVISIMSLGYPDVKFHLISDGKTVLSTLAATQKTFSEQLRGRVNDVIGEDFLLNTIPVAVEKNGIRIEGIVGVPSYTRHNRSGQYLFINRRAVTSNLVTYAVKDGYGTALATGRHPAFILHLTIPGEMVDVNVHPQKREVRLRQESMIRDLIAKAVSSGLHTDSPPLHPADFVAPSERHEPTTFKFTSSPDWVFKPREEQAPYIPVALPSFPNPPPLVNSQRPVEYTHVVMEDLVPPPKKQETPRVLTTIPRYILLDGGQPHPLLFPQAPMREGMILIDQRGAHMRILYERLLKQEVSVKLPVQALLIPHTIEVSAFEADVLRSALPSLNVMGIHIKEFGPRSFAIDAIPKMFGNSNVELLIADIIRDVQTMHAGEFEEKLFQREQAKRMAAAAGRAAVSHHSRLSLEEAQFIVDQLVLCEEPRQCPAGKTIVIRLSTEELAKLFQKSL